MSEASPRRDTTLRTLAWLSYAAVGVAVIVPLLITLDRFRRPFGEKYMTPHLGGSADLWLPFNGARALLAGIDPYMRSLPLAFRDPTGWPQTYPPTMLLLYVPLVLVTNADIELACQVFYWLNLGALALFAVVVWRLARALRDDGQGDSLGTLLMVLVALSLNTAAMFAIDRGQSELINAALCWTGIWLFTRGRFGAALAIVTLAAAIKGYAVVLALGLLLATPTRRTFLRGLLAAGLVTLAVTLPVAAHLPSGLAAMLMRNDYAFGVIWYNHSFKSLFYHVSPAGSDVARLVLLAFAFLVSALAWWRLASAMRRGDRSTITCRAIMFATAALGLMVGMPAYSGPYNFLLVLPGLLLLATSFDRFAGLLHLKLPFALPLGIGSAVALGLALQMRWIGSNVPLGGIALVYALVAVGSLSLIPAGGYRSAATGA